jgi:hypothetical protein
MSQSYTDWSLCVGKIAALNKVGFLSGFYMSDHVPQCAAACQVRRIEWSEYKAGFPTTSLCENTQQNNTIKNFVMLKNCLNNVIEIRQKI